MPLLLDLFVHHPSVGSDGLLILVFDNYVIDVFLSYVCISRIFDWLNQIYMYAVFKVHSSGLYLSHKPLGLSGLEPPTSRLSGVRSHQLSYKPIRKLLLPRGDEEIRTLDPLLARQVLSQLSYIPI